MRRLLACIDFSARSPRVLLAARQLAAALQAEVVLLHVAPPDPDFVGYGAGPRSVRDAVSHDLRAAHSELDALAREGPDDGVAVQPLMIQGSAPEKILEQAERLSVEYIVIGSHGHGAVHEILTGSVARRVLRQARVPVVVVP